MQIFLRLETLPECDRIFFGDGKEEFPVIRKCEGIQI